MTSINKSASGLTINKLVHPNISDAKVKKAPLGFIIQLFSSKDQMANKTLEGILKLKFPKVTDRKRLYSNTLRTQCVALYNFTNRPRFTNNEETIPNVPSSVPTKDEYDELLDTLTEQYKEMTTADLLLNSEAPKGLEYEHWMAVICALASKIEDAELVVNHRQSQQFKNLRPFTGMADKMAEALNEAIFRFLAEDKNFCSIGLELPHCKVTDKTLNALSDAIQGEQLISLDLSGNLVELKDFKLKETLIKRISSKSSPFFLTLTNNRLSKKVKEELKKAKENGHCLTKVTLSSD